MTKLGLVKLCRPFHYIVILKNLNLLARNFAIVMMNIRFSR